MTVKKTLGDNLHNRKYTVSFSNVTFFLRKSLDRVFSLSDIQVSEEGEGRTPQPEPKVERPYTLSDGTSLVGAPRGDGRRI